jgi:hypothetical protein
MERHSPREKIVLWASLALGLLGFFFFQRNYGRAFPEAAIDLKVSAAQAKNGGQAFLAGQGLSTAGCKNAVVFSGSDESKTYLERELGLEEANRLQSSGQVKLWWWHSRWFKPLQKEEFRTSLDPATGRLIGYQHQLEEAAPGASLTRDQARLVAESFLVKTLGYPKAQWTPVSATTTKRPRRLDHDFVWEKSGFKAKDATWRLEISVLGAAVGGYEEFLKIPEQWSRDYQTLRSHNETFQSAAEVGFYGLLACMLGLLLWRPRGQARRRLSWKPALLLSGLGFVLSLAQSANDAPFALMGYDTTSSYPGFILQQISGALLGGLENTLLLLLMLLAGEAVYREQFPQKTGLSRMLSWKGFRSREFHLACGIGLAGAFIGLAYQTGYYVFGRRFGIWCPSELKYEDLVRTALPWVNPLAGAFSAAVLEEAAFRMFAIGFFRKVLKNTPLAIFLSAISWSFLHSNYPQQPAWCRGVELSVMGCFLGWMMTRFGILASIATHFTLDAVLMGLFLVRSEVPAFRISGLVVGGFVALPFLAASALALLKQGFEPLPLPLPQEAEPGVASPRAEKAPAVTVVPLSSAALKKLAMAGLLGLAAFVWFRASEAGDSVGKVGITRSRAQAIADLYLKARGQDPSPYHRVTFFSVVDDPSATHFLYEKLGLEGVKKAYTSFLIPDFWKTWYFLPGKKQGFAVIVSSEGKVIGRDDILEEDGPGANWDQGKAREVAERSLAAEYGADLKGFKLADASSEKRKARTDHHFEWETEAGAVGDARYRQSTEVFGDGPSGYWRYLKVPEDWLRKRQERGWKDGLASTLQSAASMGAMVGLVVAFLAGFRKAPQWKPVLGFAAFKSAVVALVLANGLPTLFQGYQTELSLQTFYSQTLLADLMSLGQNLIGPLVLAGALLSLYRTCYDVSPWPQMIPSTAGRTVLLTAFSCALFKLGLDAAHASLPLALHWPQTSLGLTAPGGLDDAIPALEGLRQAVSEGLIGSMTAIGLFLVLRFLLRRDWAAWTVWTLISAGTALAGTHGTGEYLVALSGKAVTLGTWALLFWALGTNLWAWACYAVIWAFLDSGMDLIVQPNGWFQANGLACFVLALLLPLAILKIGPKAEEARILA